MQKNKRYNMIQLQFRLQVFPSYDTWYKLKGNSKDKEFVNAVMNSGAAINDKSMSCFS